MKKVLCFMLFLLAFGSNLNAQNDSIVRVTKHQALDSQKGKIIKYEDKKTNDIPCFNSQFPFKCKIRTFFRNGINSYFLILGDTYKIEYSDLVEINKAFDKFYKEVDADCALKPEYLENKYITDDGFKIGYYVKKGKPTWFVDLNIYSVQGFGELKKPFDFSEGLKNAQSEIEKMINGK